MFFTSRLAERENMVNSLTDSEFKFFSPYGALNIVTIGVRLTLVERTMLILASVVVALEINPTRAQVLPVFPNHPRQS